MTMDTTMELDDLKQAWRALDHRLQQQNALALQAYRDRQADKARRNLRPLFWGQVAQMLFGLLFVLLAAALWMSPARLPAAVVAAGVVVHAYGIAVVVASGIVLGLIRRIDYGAPVLAIQTQLAQLRRAYVIGGMVAGLPWWVLWMLPFMLLAAMGDNDTGLAWLDAFLGTGIAIGIAGLLGTWWFHRWARRPGRERLARRLEDGLSGASLRKAQRQLDELRQFERE
jgi:hypothetical protein